jgi:RimJ/RimL family protein N-acetyltransferase
MHEGQLAIRPARPAEAGALAQLITSAYRGESSRRGWTSEADLVEGIRTDATRIRQLITGPGSVVLVLAGEDSPAALAGCCAVSDRGDGLAYFGTFAVPPAEQGGGRGRRLLTAAQRQAVLRFGSNRMEMTVLAPQAALIGWYERQGFRRTGETRPFPAHDVYARPLRDDLYFVVLAKDLSGSGQPGD